MADESQGSTATLRAGLVVVGITMLGAFGPTIGISPAWIVVVVLGGLVASVDAASWQGWAAALSRRHSRGERLGSAASLCMKQDT